MALTFGSGSSSITFSDILKIVSEYDILAHYLGITEVPCTIKSPFRNERNPSFNLNTFDGKKIFYYDFGSKQTGGTFDLLQRLWNLDMSVVLKKVYDDTKYIVKHNKTFVLPEKLTTGKRRYSNNTQLEVKIRDWKNKDFEFWSLYGLNKQWLEFGTIYPISHIIVTKQTGRYVIPTGDYAYVFIEYKDDITIKIYQPFNSTHKWISKHDSSVWDLWRQLPEKGENLIITSSRKDALSTWAATGIPSTGLQGEGYLPKLHVINQLKERFTNIYVLYDNDYDSEINYGRLHGQTLANMYGLKQIEIPTKFKSKDSSDLHKNHGLKIQQKVIFNLLK